MSRTLIFIYGIIVYCVFLPTFLYAIGFVGNVWVPKSIDVGPGTSTTIQAILINAGLLSVFALQHSIMARPAFKRWWTKIVSKAAERSTFVLLSSLALILLYWQWQPMPATIWDVSQNTILSGILTTLYYVGWLIVLLSTFMINHFDLFGLKQVYENLVNKPEEPMKFTVGYLYAFVRHPIMLGFIIAFWSTPVMTVGHLFFSVMTTAYILIAVKYLEERDLRNSLGSEYVDYMKETPMLIPYKGRYRKN